MCDVYVSDTLTMVTTSIPTSLSDPVMSTSKGDPASDNSTLADAKRRNHDCRHFLAEIQQRENNFF